MSIINFTTGSNIIISYKVTVNSAINSSWVINGCTLHDSVSVKYCKETCRMGEHCQVWRVLQKMSGKEKVQFT